MSRQRVLIDGEWRASQGRETFQAVNPATLEALPGEYPVSPRAEIEQAIAAGARAARETANLGGEVFAAFLEGYATAIESRGEGLVATANAETALPVAPRLKDVELPRTTNQLRQAAAAARDGGWKTPTIDTKLGIRSQFGPLGGPVSVFGPNNFPFAFNSIAGGDFAAAVAAGNPVIAKGHSSHPGTTRLFAEAAVEALAASDLPPAFVQLIYRTSHADGALLVAHRSIGASGYTGSRSAGLVLKEAADKAGKPIYLELSSINPVFILPGAIAERGAELAGEFTTSCLMGTGQFCTNPGLVLLVAGPQTEAFIADVSAKFQSAPIGTFLSDGVRKNFESSIAAVVKAGAKLLAGEGTGGGKGASHPNVLLRAEGRQFIANPEAFQTEMFGNGSLFVVAKDANELVEIAAHLEGNLTGCVYSAKSGADDALYDRVAPLLRRKVGRLLNDKMPTGVAVSPAMNHGGPFPATGHPVFTSVGIPAAIHRFAMLESYDNVRSHRLPPALRDKNPTGSLWRFIDGAWTQGDVKLV